MSKAKTSTPAMYTTVSKLADIRRVQGGIIRPEGMFIVSKTTAKTSTMLVESQGFSMD